MAINVSMLFYASQVKHCFKLEVDCRFNSTPTQDFSLPPCIFSGEKFLPYRITIHHHCAIPMTILMKECILQSELQMFQNSTNIFWIGIVLQGMYGTGRNALIILLKFCSLFKLVSAKHFLLYQRVLIFND